MAEEPFQATENRRIANRGMTPHYLRTVNVNATIRTVLDGLFYRLERLSTASHPGWDDFNRHSDALNKLRYRIIDVIASQYPEGQLPDTLAVTHDHNVYRIDNVNGTVKVIGSIPRHLPDLTEVMHLLEV